MRVGERPASDGARESQPPILDSRARTRDRLLRRGTDGVVGVDDERGQQVIAAGEVAVHRRRGHAERPGDRPQGEVGAVLCELCTGLPLDVLGEGGSGPCPGRRGGADGAHSPSVVQNESSGKNHEQCSCLGAPDV